MKHSFLNYTLRQIGNLDSVTRERIQIATENFTKLGVCGEALHTILSQATILPETVDEIRRLFKEAADLTDQVIP